MTRQSESVHVISHILSSLLILMIVIGYTPAEVKKINSKEQISIPHTTQEAQLVNLPDQKILVLTVKRIRKESINIAVYLLVFAVMHRQKLIRKWERFIRRYKTYLKLALLMDYIHDMDGKKHYSFC